MIEVRCALAMAKGDDAGLNQDGARRDENPSGAISRAIAAHFAHRRSGTALTTETSNEPPRNGRGASS